MEITVKKIDAYGNKVYKKLDAISDEEKILSIAHMFDKVIGENVSLLKGSLAQPKQTFSYTSLSKHGNDYNSFCSLGFENCKKTLDVSFQYNSFHYLYDELLPVILFVVAYSYTKDSKNFVRIKTTFEETIEKYKKENVIDKDSVKSLSKDIYDFLQDINIRFAYDELSQKQVLTCYNLGLLSPMGKSYFKIPMFED